MRKRTQKKRGVGPYQPVCFSVSLMAKSEGDYDWNDFFAAFRGFLEGHRLRAMASDDPATIVVDAGRRADNAERRRHAVIEWLNDRPEIESARVSELLDSRQGRTSHPSR